MIVESSSKIQKILTQRSGIAGAVPWWYHYRKTNTKGATNFLSKQAESGKPRLPF